MYSKNFTPVNPLSTEFHFESIFLEAIDTLYDLYFHFCCELALKTWAKGSSINSLGVHDLATPIHSIVTSSLTSKCSSWQKMSTVPAMESLQRPMSGFYGHLCKKGEKRPGNSQPRQLLCSHHPWLCSPTSHIPPFSQVQNQSDCTNW